MLNFITSPSSLRNSINFLTATAAYLPEKLQLPFVEVKLLPADASKFAIKKCKEKLSKDVNYFAKRLRSFDS